MFPSVIKASKNGIPLLLVRATCKNAVFFLIRECSSARVAFQQNFRQTRSIGGVHSWSLSETWSTPRQSRRRRLVRRRNQSSNLEHLTSFRFGDGRRHPLNLSRSLRIEDRTNGPAKLLAAYEGLRLVRLLRCFCILAKR